MSKNILMVMTSQDSMGKDGGKTGIWLEEFTAPYYAFIDKGYSVTLASPMGGQVPVDPNSLTDDALTETTARFEQDDLARSGLASTIPIEDVRADEFDAVFYPGGHGPLWDLADNQDSIALIEAMLKQGKPVGAVCHASIALKEVKDSDGQPVVQGREVTGFSNQEEDAVGLTEVVPYLVEDELKAKGANYSNAGNFEPYVLTSGLLVTGQNPPSSKPAADEIIKLLG